VKLWGTLLVRDEVDVVAACIEHALFQGVEHVIVTDNASIDGTRETLADYESAGVITVIDEPNTQYRQSEWVTRMSKAACAAGADWIIHLDADEFPKPLAPGVTLAHTLARLDDSVTVVQSPRRNLRRRRGDNRPWVDALLWKDSVSLSERGTPIGPKVAHRADPDALVLMGNHSVQGPLLGAPDASPRIEYLHVPDRSWRQYESKIRVGGQSVESNPEFDAGVSWHWRSDYARLTNGTLEAEYARRQVGAVDLAAAVVRRRSTRETYLRDTLHALRDRAAVPERLRHALLSEPNPAV
jgi:glycosyltransferase involved in cell wall biosynthesis